MARKTIMHNIHKKLEYLMFSNYMFSNLSSKLQNCECCIAIKILWYCSNFNQQLYVKEDISWGPLKRVLRINVTPSCPFNTKHIFSSQCLSFKKKKMRKSSLKKQVINCTKILVRLVGFTVSNYIYLLFLCILW